MTLETAHVVVVFGAGTANEVTVATGAQDVCLLEADVSLSVGPRGQKATLRLLDRIGAWRKIAFGSSCDVYLNGTLTLSGTTTVPRRDVAEGGTAVLMEIDVLGRTYVLYSKPVSADESYQDMTTGAIAKAVIDAEFVGTLTTTNVSSAGETLTLFEVSEGENVGSVLERLTAQDGFVFFVDTSDDVTYQAVSASSQATIYESDLNGEPGDKNVEPGVSPPRNVVRVIGGTGYAASIIDDTQDGSRVINASGMRWAKRFVAPSDRLSAVQLYLNRGTAANVPDDLTLEIHTDAPEAGSGQSTTTTLGSVNFALDATTDRAVIVLRPFNLPGVRVASIDINGTRVGTPGTCLLKVYTVDADNKPLTLVDTQTATVGLSGISFSWPGGSRLSVDPTLKYAFVFEPSAGTWNGSNRFDCKAGGTDGQYVAAWNSTDSGSTWNAQADRFSFSFVCDNGEPSGTLVEFGTLSVSAEDVYPTPPAWSGYVSFAGDKLALTEGTAYWLVARCATATASLFWEAYYDTISDYSAANDYLSATSITNWSTSVGAVAMARLYFSNDTPDVTVEDAASIAAYGEWYHEESRPDVTSTEQATNVANAIIDAYATPPTRLTLPCTTLKPTLTPKQVITVKRPLLDINGDYTISEIRHEVRADRARTVIVTGAKPYNAARSIVEVSKKV